MTRTPDRRSIFACSPNPNLKLWSSLSAANSKFSLYYSVRRVFNLYFLALCLYMKYRTCFGADYVGCLRMYCRADAKSTLFSKRAIQSRVVTKGSKVILVELEALFEV